MSASGRSPETRAATASQASSNVRSSIHWGRGESASRTKSSSETAPATFFAMTQTRARSPLGIAECFAAFLPKPELFVDDASVEHWSAVALHHAECHGITVEEVLARLKR